jgi:hypothetical protein
VRFKYQTLSNGYQVALLGSPVDNSRIDRATHFVWIELRFELDKADHGLDTFLQGSKPWRAITKFTNILECDRVRSWQESRLQGAELGVLVQRPSVREIRFRFSIP